MIYKYRNDSASLHRLIILSTYLFSTQLNSVKNRPPEKRYANECNTYKKHFLEYIRHNSYLLTSVSQPLRNVLSPIDSDSGSSTNTKYAMRSSSLWSRTWNSIELWFFEILFKDFYPSTINWFLGRSTPDSESGREDRTILTFKVNFLCKKSSESFQFFFIEEY